MISHLSGTEKLISKLDFNWVWEQLANCSYPSLQFAPVSHSSLIYFLIFSPCFAIVSLLALRLPLAAQNSEKVPVFHVRLSQAMRKQPFTAEAPARRSTAERPLQLRAEERVQGPGWHASPLLSQYRHIRNRQVKAEEISGTE